MKHTISVLVENHAGVLSKISGLFSRRGFNIDSLAVGVTEDAGISRMTIVVDGDDYLVEQMEKQLNKLIDVIKVKTIKPGQIIARELVLVKVSSTAAQRGEIMNIAEIMGASIIDISPTTLTLQFADTAEQVDLFEKLLRQYKIREVVRTGTVALEKGVDTIDQKVRKF